jgi:hypothetical protein
VAGSPTDVPLADFGRLFGYNGVYDMFFKTELANLVDTSRSPWAWRRDASGAAVGGSVSMLRQFEAADRIRNECFSVLGSKARLPRCASFECACLTSRSRIAASAVGRVYTLDCPTGRHSTILIMAPSVGRSRHKTWPGPNPGRAIATFEERTGGRPNNRSRGPGGMVPTRLTRPRYKRETDAVYVVTIGEDTAHESRIRVESISIEIRYGNQAVQQFAAGRELRRQCWEVGFYGKLPSHGDFLRRRVSDAFVRGWDAWRRNASARAETRLGDRWLDVYLTSPAWRFALRRRTLGPAPVIGLMVPSVDRRSVATFT